MPYRDRFEGGHGPTFDGGGGRGARVPQVHCICKGVDRF